MGFKSKGTTFSSKVVLVLLASVLFLSSFAGFAGVADAAEKGAAKNVILMIPDGMGASYMTASRIFKGEELSFERYIKGMMKIKSANTNITDSAAAGTAMATGYKTNNGVISVTPDGKKPDSILDAARKKGKSTGLVATSTITHATPAVFTSHDESRGNEVVLAQEYIKNVDVILGGGQEFFTLEKSGGKQKERDLVAEAKQAGYDYITSRNEMAKSKSNKVLGLFAKGAMTYEIDRPDTQPSLAEMTEFAINKLSQDNDGFFLMVEGSQIDWAGHAFDPVAAITDTLAFEAAVNKALEFAKNRKDTLVVIVGDHETGGMTIGTTAGGYKENINLLKNANGSSNSVAAALKTDANKVSLKDAKAVNGKQYFPLRNLVSHLNGELKYDAAARAAVANVLGKSFTIKLGAKEVDFILENGITYINVQSFAGLIGLQGALGTAKDKPEATVVYFSDVKKALKSVSGIDITDEQAKRIVNVNWDGRFDLSNEIGAVVSEHALISWGTRHHSGVDIPLYAYGTGAEEFVGLIDNTDLPRIISFLQGTELFTNEQAFMNKLQDRRTRF